MCKWLGNFHPINTLGEVLFHFGSLVPAESLGKKGENRKREKIESEIRTLEI